VLLMHGEHDTVVPVEDARRLQAAAARDSVQLHIGSGGHDSMDAFLEQMPQVIGFLNQVNSAPSDLANRIATD
jgi:hypothetical protein